MSAYSGSPNTSSNLQLVRMHLGSDSTDFVTDQEIAVVLGNTSSVGRAIAAAFNVYLANLALKVDMAIGRTRLSLSQKFDQVARLRDYWQKNGDGGLTGSTVTATMFAGSQSKDKVRTYRRDNDLTQPSFAVGMDDNPGNEDRRPIDPDDP